MACCPPWCSALHLLALSNRHAYAQRGQNCYGLHLISAVKRYYAPAQNPTQTDTCPTKHLIQGGDADAGATAAAELAESPRSLAQLFNDYAAPAHLWALAIECIDLARYEDEGNVRQLWDLLLVQVGRWSDAVLIYTSSLCKLFQLLAGVSMQH